MIDTPEMNEPPGGTEPGLGAELPYPLGVPAAPSGPLRRLWRSPLFRLVLYYAVLLLVAGLLLREFPLVRRALITPAIPIIDEGAALLNGAGPPPGWSQAPALLSGTIERALTTMLVVLGAVALAIPSAWVYMMTKRLRYDPGIVRSVVILPIAVAGILLVVKHSLAIAFSLAGIVAAVRFRNTLKDPRDAVFIFLTIAIGIAAGVQALDVALVVSMVFNATVLTLWRFQVGSVYGGRYGRTGVLSIGDPELFVAQTPAARRSVRRHVLERAEEMKTDGILLIHARDPARARDTVQNALSVTTRDWRLLGFVSRGGSAATGEYLVRLARKTTPGDLIGAIEEWSAQVAAAEYIPFRARGRKRKEEGREGAAGEGEE